MTDMSTIGDVAERAGVSVATVSRALRGLPHVSAATRAHVRRIADELDYRPNPHAARLAAGRSGTVGIALPVLNSWFYGNVLAGVHSVLSRDGIGISLITVDDEQAVSRFGRRLRSLSKEVDALLICDLFLPDVVWNDLVVSGVPTVTLGVESDLFDAVRIDDEASGRMAVEHLLELGHRRIGFIGPGDDEPLPFQTGNLRERGWAETLREAGLEPDGRLAEPGGFRLEGGRKAMLTLLDGDRAPTAVFAASDEMAIGAMWAARDRGIPIPGELSIVGFDDHRMAEAVDLTTVAQPVERMAARAAQLLIDRAEGNRSERSVIVADTHLVIRGTTGRPPRAVDGGAGDARDWDT